MPTVTVLDDSFSDATTVTVASRPAAVGGSWSAIEITAGAGVDSARVIGGTGFAYSSSGSGASGNRSGLVLTSEDWDVYFDVDRPNNFGSVRLMAGANASGVGGWMIILSNFSDTIRLFSDSTSFSGGGEGTERVNVGHSMPLGASTYQLQKRGPVLRMFRNNVQLGTDWTDPSPTAAPGCVMFWAVQSDNIAISRVWATIEAPDITITGPSGAAGAASITHSVNENQNNAGIWSATGGTSWSLSGTDAALLSISSGGVVTLASGNFDHEAKASYSFTVLRDGVAQAVTLNITDQAEAPLAPTIGTATAGNAQATVTFTPPNNAGRPPITSYRVTSTPGGLFADGAASPITVTGLTNGVSYAFSVTATNDEGTGPASAQSNSVTPSTGGDVIVPTLTGSITIGSVTSSSIQFSWPAGADNVGVVGYDVSSNGGSTWDQLGNVLTHTFTGLSPSTAYGLRVRARDAAGNVSTPPLSAAQSTSAAGTFSATVGPFSLNTGSPALGSGTLSFTAVSGETGTSGSVISGTVSIGAGGTGTISSFPSSGLWQVNLRNADGSGRWHNVVTAA